MLWPTECAWGHLKTLAGLMRLFEELHGEHWDRERRMAAAVSWPLPWAVRWPQIPNHLRIFFFPLAPVVLGHKL